MAGQADQFIHLFQQKTTKANAAKTTEEKSCQSFRSQMPLARGLVIWVRASIEEVKYACRQLIENSMAATVCASVPPIS